MLVVTDCYSSISNSGGDVSMQSAGSPDVISPRHFIIEKGLSDARGEVDARVQVFLSFDNRVTFSEGG